MSRAIYVGWDRREVEAFSVAVRSTCRHLSQSIPVVGHHARALRQMGVYTRPETTHPDGRVTDDISGAPMSTEFSNSRFVLFKTRPGWTLFMDCDMLVRRDLAPLFDEAERTDFAVMCVKHDHSPREAVKMDGQVQTTYPRKNWSSFMLFRGDHPANQRLRLEDINTRPGRDLHAYFWLEDREIGALDPAYNYLVGHTRDVPDPAVVHFTEGGPWFPEYADVEYAAEWRAERARC